MNVFKRTFNTGSDIAKVTAAVATQTLELVNTANDYARENSEYYDNIAKHNFAHAVDGIRAKNANRAVVDKIKSYVTNDDPAV